MPVHHPNSAYGQIDKAIASYVCSCGGSKAVGVSFCFSCFKALPPKLRAGLNHRLGDSFYSAYEDAVEHLKEIGEIRR